MKFASTVIASSILLTAQAQLLPFWSKPSAARLVPPPDRLNQKQQQAMNPGIQLPGTSDDQPPSSTDPKGDVILSDVIGTQRSINIFAGFTRDVETLSKRLDTSGLNTTVLAPVNSAISDLPRKPWEDPRDYAAMGAEAYDGEGGEDRAHRNLRRFAEAHVVPASPWKEGEKVQTMGGSTVWWEKKDGVAVVQPGEVEIDRVVSKVANGEVWILKGVLNYA